MPQTAALPTEVPQRLDQSWNIAMPKEIAELFGVPEGSPVTFFVQPGNITAWMNLAPQTDEARQREPGWFLEMPPEMAEAAGATVGSVLGLYAKLGTTYVEIYPPPDDELKEIVREILENRRADFEEMKRRGD